MEFSDILLLIFLLVVLKTSFYNKNTCRHTKICQPIMKMHCRFETFLGERLKNSNSTSSSFRPNEVIKKKFFECIAQTLSSRPVRSDSLTIIVTARRKIIKCLTRKRYERDQNTLQINESLVFTSIANN